MRWTFDKECNQFKLQIAMDNNGKDIVGMLYLFLPVSKHQVIPYDNYSAC